MSEDFDKKLSRVQERKGIDSFFKGLYENKASILQDVENKNSNLKSDIQDADDEIRVLQVKMLARQEKLKDAEVEEERCRLERNAAVSKKNCIASKRMGARVAYKESKKRASDAAYEFQFANDAVNVAECVSAIDCLLASQLNEALQKAGISANIDDNSDELYLYQVLEALRHLKITDLHHFHEGLTLKFPSVDELDEFKSTLKPLRKGHHLLVKESAPLSDEAAKAGKQKIYDMLIAERIVPEVEARKVLELPTCVLRGFVASQQNRY